MEIHSLVVGHLATNCYILACKGKAVVIDPGAEPERITDFLLSRSLRLEFVINTHGHADHILGDDALSRPVYIHKDDVPFLKDSSLNMSGFFGRPFEVKTNDIRILEGTEVIDFAGNGLQIIHTPGHTPGSICIKAGDFLFSGDTLFFHSVGRTDIPYAKHEDLIKSIREKLLVLPGQTRVFPGHGKFTTIAEEKNNNPFFNNRDSGHFS